MTNKTTACQIFLAQISLFKAFILKANKKVQKLKYQQLFSTNVFLENPTFS